QWIADPAGWHDRAMEVHKAPTGRGLSYPLKTSALFTRVEAAGLETSIVLHYRSERWWTEGVFFRADFRPPARPSAPSELGDVLHVTCRSVPSSERKAAQTYLEQSVLPEFIGWLSAFERLPASATARREKPSFTRSWP